MILPLSTVAQSDLECCSFLCNAVIQDLNE
uniref:Uncharacterized protein n=1 Tax=Arundo donax TaxID=35708 RepID=A0A0A9BPQ5_ARUDO